MSGTILQQISTIKAKLDDINEKIELQQMQIAHERGHFHPRLFFIRQCERRIKYLELQKLVFQQKLDEIDKI